MSLNKQSLPIGQKGVAHLLLLILIVLGIGLGIYLVQNPAIFKPKADQDPSKCIASDFTSFKECLSSVQDNESVDKIEITKQIVCNSKADCTSIGSGGGFTLRKRTRPLSIFGTPNTAAGFKRVNEYNYALLSIGGDDVKDITIKDLIFDDTTQECNEETLGNCISPLVISKSSNTLVDHITILHAKDHGIQISQAFNPTIKNSIIYNSNTNGIWMDDGRSDPCTNFITCPSVLEKRNSVVTIENNLIANSRVAAIEFYAYGNDQQHSTIKGNLLVHNHRDSKFIFCPPQVTDDSGRITQRGGHCPGGQLAIARTEFLDVEGNIIRDGHIDGTKPNDPYLPEPGAKGAGKRYDEDLGLHTSGIELSTQLESILVRNNKIYNNTGAGIFADYTFYNLAQMGLPNTVGRVGVIQLSDNFLDKNNPNMGRVGVLNLDNVPGIYNVRNGRSISVKSPKAFIFADPPICDPVNNAATCKTQIKWYSEDYPNLLTVINGKSSNPNHTADGTQSSDELPAAGSVAELREGPDLNSKVIASTYIQGTSKASNPTPPIDPSPSPSPTSISQPSPSPRTFSSEGLNGILSASPNPCSLGASGLCTIRISWNSSYPNLKITLKENPGSVFAAAASGSQDAPWISATGATFEARNGNDIVDTLFVAGTINNSQPTQPTLSNRGQNGILSASVNPCRLNPSGLCTIRVSWNSSYPDLTITIKENPGSLFAAAASGSQDAPWISATGATFEARSKGQVVDSLFLKGN